MICWIVSANNLRPLGARSTIRGVVDPSRFGGLFAMARKRLLSLKNALWCVATAAVLVLSSLSGMYVAAGTAQAASSASAARPCNI